MSILKSLFCLAMMLTCTSVLHAQEDLGRIAKGIEQEGKLLYRSERASWLGTDIFMEHCPDKRSDIGGYLSYSYPDGAKCIFFSKEKDAKVIGTITFDTSYSLRYALLDSSERDFTSQEKELFIIREAASEVIRRDTFFRHYDNTNLNIIPLISGGTKKVYVLTGTSQPDVMIFGNDYLITFNDDNSLKEKRRLHQNLIATPFGDAEQKKEKDTIVGGIHTHLPASSPFMTPTDICTVMLYYPFTKWLSYSVVSEKYISIWSCTGNSLIIITTDVLNKISNDQGKRKSKR